MSRPPALVLLNPAARHGRAGRLWDRVRHEVEQRFDSSVVPTDPGGTWKRNVRCSLRAGTRVFVAAGGDGTVHALAGAIVEARDGVPLGDICLGAVGLGSSNDFHKPFERLRSGIPLRLDMDRATPRDLGRIRRTAFEIVLFNRSNTCPPLRLPHLTRLPQDSRAAGGLAPGPPGGIVAVPRQPTPPTRPNGSC